MLVFYLSLIQNDEDRYRITHIYETYLDWMLKMAFHYLKNETDAEDAVNDVFLNIISGNCSVPFNNENETKAYLFICIRNSAFNVKRLRNKHKTVNCDELFNISVKYDLEESFFQRDSYNEILSFINTMSPIYKDVLTLKITFDKTLKEISKILNIPFKTAETRYIRGRAILKERFGDIEI